VYEDDDGCGITCIFQPHCAWKAQKRGSLGKVSNPIPQGSQIFIIERQLANVFIKLDRMPQALFRFLHATGDARVAGKIKSDHGHFGVYRLRLQQNGFGFFNTLAAPD
jgi:hypothetical protein